jgi:hypothetical protein
MSRNRPVILRAVPSDWLLTMRRRKTVFGWPEWSKVAELRTGKKVQPPRDDVHTVSTEETFAIFQLADENGVHIEGLRLRLTAWAYKRHKDVTATLEVVGGRNFVTISRVDAWPSTPHHNSFKVLKRLKGKGLSEVVSECHVHRFEDNEKYGPEAFGPGPEGNLPVAVAFPNALQSFREFLRSVGDEFNIDGLDDFPSPSGWQGLI